MIIPVRKKLKATEKRNILGNSTAVNSSEYFTGPYLILENMRHLPVYFNLTVKQKNNA